MKKFLMVSGIAFWAFVVVAIIIFIWSIHFDATSKAYVDQNIPIIVSTWSEGELLKLASPEFKSAISKDQSDKTWSNFMKLGALEKYNGSKGQAYVNGSFWTGKNGEKRIQITAKYVASVDFHNGSVKIFVDLVRENGEWKIYYFSVNQS
jgi:hypothetical protein